MDNLILEDLKKRIPLKENPNELSALPLIGSLLDFDEFGKCGEVLDGHSIVHLGRRMIDHVLCRTAAGVKAEVCLRQGWRSTRIKPLPKMTLTKPNPELNNRSIPVQVN